MGGSLAEDRREGCRGGIVSTSGETTLLEARQYCPKGYLCSNFRDSLQGSLTDQGPVARGAGRLHFFFHGIWLLVSGVGDRNGLSSAASRPSCGCAHIVSPRVHILSKPKHILISGRAPTIPIPIPGSIYDDLGHTRTWGLLVGRMRQPTREVRMGRTLQRHALRAPRRIWERCVWALAEPPQHAGGPTPEGS